MLRSPDHPSAMFADMLTNVDRRMTAAERRATWPGAVRSAWEDVLDPSYPGPEEMTTPGYPTYFAETASLTLDPGRWVVVYRATLAIAASDGGEVGMVSTAVVDGVTTTKVSRGGGATTPVGSGNSYTLSNALEVIAVDTIELSLPVYWGYEPLVDMVPYLFYSLFGASIVAYPG